MHGDDRGRGVTVGKAGVGVGDDHGRGVTVGKAGVGVGDDRGRGVTVGKAGVGVASGQLTASSGQHCWRVETRNATVQPTPPRTHARSAFATQLSDSRGFYAI